MDSSRTDLLGRAAVEFDVYPVIESIAVDLSKGRTVPAGAAQEVLGLGRLFETGGANAQFKGDGDEANATYLKFPFPRRCSPALPNQERDCVPTNVALPDFRFSTSDPGIASFVERDPLDPARPLRRDGSLVPSETSGLLCTFKPGQVMIRAESGRHGSQIPVRVTGGDGACIDEPIIENTVIPTKPPPPRVQPRPEIPVVNPPPPVRARLPEVAAAAAIAPPPINPAPAPPAGGAGGRQEEHEAASERANFVARVIDSNGVPGPEALMVLLLPLIAYTAARIVSSRNRKEVVPARAHILPSDKEKF